jgi:hypothetical protein
VMIYDVYITVSIYIYRHMERGTYNNHLLEKKTTIKLLLYSYIYILYTYELAIYYIYTRYINIIIYT